MTMEIRICSILCAIANWQLAS